MDGFMLIFLLSARRLILRAAGLKKREEAAGRRILPDPVLLATPSLKNARQFVNGIFARMML